MSMTVQSLPARLLEPSRCIRLSSRRRPSIARGKPVRAAVQQGTDRSTATTTSLTSLDLEEETWSEAAHASMEALKQRFRRADLDGNGVIDRSELRGLLQMVDSGDEIVPVSWLTEEDLDRIMRQYDTNRDGVLQFEEFVKLAQDGVVLQGKLQEYREAFRQADTNADGRLGPRELLKLFKELGHPLTYDTLVKIFEEYDLDNTGSIELPEFLRMFRNKLLDLDQILGYIALQGQPWDSAATPVDVELLSQQLTPGMVSEVMAEADLDAVLSARSQQLVVLMCTLPWCRDSRALSRQFDALARQYPGAIFLRLNGSANPGAKSLFKDRLKCRATPAFFYFRHGSVRGKYTGAFPEKVEHELRLFLYPDPMPPLLFDIEKSTGVLGED